MYLQSTELNPYSILILRDNYNNAAQVSTSMLGCSILVSVFNVE